MLLKERSRARLRRRGITIDKQLSPSMRSSVDKGDLMLANGVPIPLTENDQSRRIYSKFESPNPELSDTQHGDVWKEQFTAHNRVMLLGEEEREEVGIHEDDGLILTFEGYPEDEVAIDLRNNRVIDLDTAELEEEATGVSHPRYVRYDFYLTEALITDGPERRATLHEDAEKQRHRSESEANDKLSQVLTKILDRLEGQNPGQQLAVEEGEVVTKERALDFLLTEMSKDQLTAMIEMRQADVEYETQKAEMTNEEEIDPVIEQLTEEGALADENTPDEPSRRKRRTTKDNEK